MPTLRSLNGKGVELKGKDMSLLVFPPDTPKKRPSDSTYVLLSAPQDGVSNFIISWPGEYDYAGMIIRGIGQDEGKKVSYVATVEDLRFGFISTPLSEWSDYDLEILGDLDVLVIPGDNAKFVQRVVEEVDPPVIIPLKTNQEVWSDVLSVCGAKDVEAVKDVKLTKSGLPKESREVVVLEG